MGMGRISIPHAPIQKENQSMNNKPVAWINEDNFLLGDILNSAVYRTKPNDEFTIPLYTTPPAQVEFVSKLMADNIDQEALIQILSEKIKELTQSNARLSIELSIINRMIDGAELDPIDMEYRSEEHTSELQSH